MWKSEGGGMRDTCSHLNALGWALGFIRERQGFARCGLRFGPVHPTAPGQSAVKHYAAIYYSFLPFSCAYLP